MQAAWREAFGCAQVYVAQSRTALEGTILNLCDGCQAAYVKSCQVSTILKGSRFYSYKSEIDRFRSTSYCRLCRRSKHSGSIANDRSIIRVISIIIHSVAQFCNHSTCCNLREMQVGSYGVIVCSHSIVFVEYIELLGFKILVVVLSNKLCIVDAIPSDRHHLSFSR